GGGGRKGGGAGGTLSSLRTASAACLQSSSEAKDWIWLVVGVVGLPDTTHCSDTRSTHSIRPLPFWSRRAAGGRENVPQGKIALAILANNGPASYPRSWPADFKSSPS